MIGSEILLYPDTGPEFLRALKMAVLYTRRVHVLTLLDQELVESFAAQSSAQPLEKSIERLAPPRLVVGQRVPVGGGGVPVPSTPKVSEYLSFIRQNLEDFSLLVSEGLLTSDFPKAFGFGGTFSADANVRRVCERWPPSYWDFLQSLPLDPPVRLASFQGHLCFVASIAQQLGVGLATWSLDFQTALWTSLAQLAEGGPISSSQNEQFITDSDKLGHIETALAHTVLERYVMRVDDLPFEMIIELRRKCAPELDRFRHGIQQVAAEVDIDQAPEKMGLQLQDVVSRRIDPAVQALEAAMTSARLDLLKNLSRKDSGIVGGMGFAIAVAAGAPFDIGAALGAVAATIPPLISMAVDREKALRASNWAILFRLNRLQRKRDQRLKSRRGLLTIGPK